MDSVSDECDKTGISSFLYEFLLNGRRRIKFYKFSRILLVIIFTVIYKDMSSDLSGVVAIPVATESDPPPPPDDQHPDNIAAASAASNNTLVSQNTQRVSQRPRRRSISPNSPLIVLSSDANITKEQIEQHYRDRIDTIVNSHSQSMSRLRVELLKAREEAGDDDFDPRMTSGRVYTDRKGNRRRANAVTIAYVKEFMNDEYSDAGFNMSTSMDILAVYLKAQKILYTEAKVYCEQQLNMLMLPAICISALCTLLSLALQQVIAGPYIISSLTAINSFILALISYLKLDAKAEAHKTTAYNYNRLLTICEFESGKIMFFRKDSDKKDNESDEKEQKIDWYAQMLSLVIDIEKRIGEIQDTNKFMLPQYIRYNFRKLNEQNLFSKVKNLQLTELNLLNDLKNSLRKFREKEYPFLNNNKLSQDLSKLSETSDTNLIKKEFIKATADKEEKMNLIIAHRKQYLELEKDFDTEINSYVNRSLGRRCGCNWLKS